MQKIIIMPFLVTSTLFALFIALGFSCAVKGKKITNPPIKNSSASAVLSSYHLMAPVALCSQDKHWWVGGGFSFALHMTWLHKLLSEQHSEVQPAAGEL